MITRRTWRRSAAGSVAVLGLGLLGPEFSEFALDFRPAVLELADRHGIDVPITKAVEAVCYQGLAPAQMVGAMMARAMKSE